MTKLFNSPDTSARSARCRRSKASIEVFPCCTQARDARQSSHRALLEATATLAAFAQIYPCSNGLREGDGLGGERTV